MLFVVGGDDPVVRPESVLKSGPPGGSNLVQIGGLGHFLASRPKGNEEKKQRSFWLPEIGKLICRFSEEADKQQTAEQREVERESDLQQRALREFNNQNIETLRDTFKKEIKRLNDQDVLDLPPDGSLSNELLPLYVDDLLARVLNDEHSRLIISRNELPSVLLDDGTIRNRARVFHHDELAIALNCRGTALRRLAVIDNSFQIKVLLPWNAKELLEHIDPRHGFPSQSETTAGYVHDGIKIADIWNSFLTTAYEFEKPPSYPGGKRRHNAISIFDGRAPLELRGKSTKARTFIARQKQLQPDNVLFVPSLPDCWIWLSPGFFGLTKEAAHLEVATTTDQFIARVASLYDDTMPQLDVAAALREGNLRVISISRARYNPRYRGRFIVDPRAVEQILTHVALCLASAESYNKWLKRSERGTSRSKTSELQ